MHWRKVRISFTILRNETQAHLANDLQVLARIIAETRPLSHVALVLATQTARIAFSTTLATTALLFSRCGAFQLSLAQCYGMLSGSIVTAAFPEARSIPDGVHSAYTNSALAAVSRLSV